MKAIPKELVRKLVLGKDLLEIPIANEIWRLRVKLDPEHVSLLHAETGECLHQCTLVELGFCYENGRYSVREDVPSIGMLLHVFAIAWIVTESRYKARGG
jgi:hypothetical protein